MENGGTQKLTSFSRESDVLTCHDLLRRTPASRQHRGIPFLVHAPTRQKTEAARKISFSSKSRESANVGHSVPPGSLFSVIPSSSPSLGSCSSKALPSVRHLFPFKLPPFPRVRERSIASAPERLKGRTRVHCVHDASLETRWIGRREALAGRHTHYFSWKRTRETVPHFRFDG
ncbi:hypothetical protein TGVAND_294760 [Toxoplasma gondii VAND]|uniref:Uncharacterized protein n=1 Tax=Toxoplasma gondii VAND TaxID=933077 RepID=A0A086PSQ3_TOXGO|nr:hypothetical protein TGVAND_294760 [Toxoplasma gondii VAND]